MALPPEFLDELRARTPLAAVVGRRVKLAKSGRNWTGCCPFHSEKSPSFYVYEDGFHCFGCGAHGDAISFVMQTEGASFPEAVERLAGEAGLDVPKPSPRVQAVERERLDLSAVVDLAQARFVRLLHAAEGAPALAYFRSRGLTDQTISEFGLGWSGDGRGGLPAEVARHDVAPPRLLEAGLMRETDQGLRETYWSRVTFPIRDRRGRLVSFGGRTLGDAKPKYINGPETATFAKRHTLYALDRARAGVRAGAPLVVAEGYMDVIALHQAGFTGAVAPLGTALTAEQLEALWRLSPAPVICFDGDAAGGRAAARVAQTCLPQLTPERTLRFLALPAGEDPDTLIRRQGAAAMTAALGRSTPLADVLFGVLRGETPGEGPEQQAALRTRLVAAAATITDRTLADEYRKALLDRFFANRPRRNAAQSGRGFQSGRGSQGSRGSPVRAPFVRAPAQDPTAGTYRERARTLCAILLRHPDLLRDTEEAFVGLELPHDLAHLRDAIVAAADYGVLDSAALLSHLETTDTADAAASVLSGRPMPLPAYARPDAMPAEAEAGWWEIFGFMHAPSLRSDIAEAGRAFIVAPSPETQARLIALNEALDHLTQGQSPD